MFIESVVNGDPDSGDPDNGDPDNGDVLLKWNSLLNTDPFEFDCNGMSIVLNGKLLGYSVN